METFKARKYWFKPNDINSIDVHRIKTSADENLRIESQYIDDPYGIPPKYDLWWHTFYQPGKSTQGVYLSPKDGGTAEVIVPPFASKADVEYAFALMHAIEKCEDGYTLMEDKVPADLSAQAMDCVWQQCRDNMRHALEHTDAHAGPSVQVEGYDRTYDINATELREIYPEVVNSDEFVEVAFRNFAESQAVRYDYKTFEYLAIPDNSCGEDPYMLAQALTPGVEGLWIVDPSDIRPAIYYKNLVKLVNPDQLYRVALSHPAFKVYRRNFYLVSPLSDKAVERLWDALDGEVTEGPKTYLMRWNPAISSFTTEDYEQYCWDVYEEWTMDWSIWEWEKARIGDRFFMLREGDGINPGIIYRGFFISNPYPGPDWRGMGIPRHYIDMRCEMGRQTDESPWLTPEQLEEVIPGINWRSGHSGELLTPDQSASLELLWSKATKEYKI